MKTAFTIVSYIVLIASISFGYNYNAKYMDAAPTIDGVISTGEWDGAFSFPVQYPAILSAPYNGSVPSGFATPANNADLSANVYMGWDEDFIYMAFRVYDSEHNWVNSSPGPYNTQDAVQLLFNPGGYSGHFSSAGASASIIDFAAQTADSAGAGFYGRNDTRFTSPDNIIMSGAVLADGYVIEVKLLNSAFGIAPALGQSVGMGIILSDADGDAHKYLISDTSTAGAWDVNQTSSWNEFVFVSANGCGTYGLSTADLDKDCHVGLSDFSIVANNWLVCSDPAGADCTNLK